MFGSIPLPSPFGYIVVVLFALIGSVVPTVVSGVILVWLLRRLGWWPVPDGRVLRE
jgi:hypothetical protein